MDPDAERYLASGPTFLERYFPLALASRLERLLLLLVPIVLVAYPVLRGALSMGNVYFRDRLKWRYRTLRDIDREYKSYDKGQLAAAIESLTNDQENLAGDMSVPTTMLDDLYNLHYHTSLVLDRLKARLALLEEQAVVPAADGGDPH